VESCPCDAIALEEEKAVVSTDDCTDCGACVDACPEEAIAVED
jgi:NAD-dependent dihydropyrimidine dehydrogenase PreA subunit